MRIRRPAVPTSIDSFSGRRARAGLPSVCLAAELDGGVIADASVRPEPTALCFPPGIHQAWTTETGQPVCPSPMRSAPDGCATQSTPAPRLSPRMPASSRHRLDPTHSRVFRDMLDRRRRKLRSRRSSVLDANGGVRRPDRSAVRSSSPRAARAGDDFGPHAGVTATISFVQTATSARVGASHSAAATG